MKLKNNNKIIHVFDDDKFIDPAIKLFESVYPGISEYWIIKKQGEAFQYITSTIVNAFDASDKESFKKFIRRINTIEDSCPIIFLHALDQTKQNIVLELSCKVVKVWFIWGYDLYGNWPLLKNTIFEKYTKSYIDQAEKQKIKNKLIFSNSSFWVFKNLRFFKYVLPSKIENILNKNFNTVFYNAATRIDIVVPVVFDELKIIRKIGIKAIYAPFAYGCIQDSLGDKISDTVLRSNNILVGNSADPSNNHLDIFLKLSQINLGSKKVYVPLSYGGSKDYKEFIIRKGKELLGENFVPLIDFMTLQEYNKILLSCGVVVFNHIRQQGVGNIVIMGYFGARIFVNSKSPVYKSFKDYGIKIFDFKSLKATDLVPLNNKEHELNKKILFNLYSEEVVKKKIVELFDTALKVKNEKLAFKLQEQIFKINAK
jgi:dTDP-N-acetylfucosamine:lipid II N-acetylfucosaminyltransferase